MVRMHVCHFRGHESEERSCTATQRADGGQRADATAMRVHNEQYLPHGPFPTHELVANVDHCCVHLAC